jgi:hypothetical protein
MVSSHFGETVGGAEPCLVDVLFEELREDVAARPCLDDFALLIFACLQVEA